MSEAWLEDRMRASAESLPPLGASIDGVRSAARSRRRSRVLLALVGAGALVMTGLWIVPSQLLQEKVDPAGFVAAPICVSESVCGSATGTPTGSTQDAEVRELVMALWSRDDHIVDVAVHPTGGWTLWRSGPVTEDLESLGEAGDAAGVAIYVIRTSFTEDELTSAARTLMKAIRAEGIETGGVGPAADFAALEVTGPELSSDARLQARVRELAATLTPGVPIVFGRYEGRASTG